MECLFTRAVTFTCVSSGVCNSSKLYQKISSYCTENKLSTSSSSSYIFHGVGPLVDLFRSHVSRSSKVYHDSFRQLGSSIQLPWVIYFEAFYLHVVSSFSSIPVICPKLVLFLTPLQFVHLLCNLSKCILLFFSCISSLLLLFFWRHFNSPSFEEISSLNMPVQRLKVAILPLDIPCSGPVTHSGEI